MENVPSHLNLSAVQKNFNDENASVMKKPEWRWNETFFLFFITHLRIHIMQHKTIREHLRKSSPNLASYVIEIENLKLCSMAQIRINTMYSVRLEYIYTQ